MATVIIVTLSIFFFNFNQRSFDLRMLKFFDFQMDESIVLSKIGRDELNILYADLIVPSDRKEEVFKAYRLATKEKDVQYLPPDIRARIETMSPDYELDYYYILHSGVKRGFIFTIEETQAKYIVFMQERDGNVLVLLFCTHADGRWRKS